MHTGEIIDVEEVPATCSQKGLTAGRKCAECGFFVTPRFEIPTLSHKQEIIPSIPSTCLLSGKTEGIRCAICKEILQEPQDLPLGGHTLKTIVGKQPSCVETGLTDGVVCELCHEEIQPQQTVDAVGHTKHSEFCEVCGESVASSNLQFESFSNGFSLVGLGQCLDSEIIIPSTFDSKPVLKINAGVFNDKITSVFIPSSITTIENDAFKNADNLTAVYIDDLSSWCSISFGNLSANPLYTAHRLFIDGEKITRLELPKDVYRVNDYAFAGADFQAVVLPDSTSLLNDIGDYAFFDCYKIWEVYNLGQRLSLERGSMTFGYLTFYAKDIFITETETNVSVENGLILHKKSGKVTLLGVLDEVESLTLPNTINTINAYAFFGNTFIKEVEVGGQVSEIGNFAFAFSKIEKIKFDLDGSLTQIGEGAFSNVENLTELTLPSTIETIGNNAFNNLPNLNYYSKNGINYLGNENEKYLYLIDADDSLTNVQMEQSTRIICSNAFLGCVNLNSVVIANNVLEIGENAFSGLTNLSSVTLSQNLKRIKSGAFRNLSRLYLITLPSSLESISSGAFDGCYCLVEVYNLSPLSIKKTTDNGSVGLYAFDVYSSASTLSKLLTKPNQFVIYEGTRKVLVVCLLNSDTVSLSKVDVIYDYAFYCNDNLKTIQFGGTLAEWNAIQKPQNFPSTLEKIVCSDQEVLI